MTDLLLSQSAPYIISASNFIRGFHFWKNPTPVLHIDCQLCFPQGSQQGHPQQPGCVSARMTHTGRVPVPWGPEHTYSCGPHHPDSASEQDSGGELWKEDSSWGWTTVNGLKKRTRTCLCHEAISSCHQPLWKEEKDRSRMQAALWPCI